jgi:hypothetical protein
MAEMYLAHLDDAKSLQTAPDQPALPDVKEAVRQLRLKLARTPGRKPGGKEDDA